MSIFVVFIMSAASIVIIEIRNPQRVKISTNTIDWLSLSNENYSVYSSNMVGYATEKADNMFFLGDTNDFSIYFYQGSNSISTNLSLTGTNESARLLKIELPPIPN